jgi:hypothetical protein
MVDHGLEKTLADQTELRPVDGEDLTDRAIALLDHRAPLVAAAALMLLTGRRKIAILRTGTLSTITAGAAISENAPAENTLIFDGQAKTRGGVSAHTAPYLIPVLAEPQLVLDAFARRANLTNEQVHNRLCVPLDRETKLVLTCEHVVSKTADRSAIPLTTFSSEAPSATSGFIRTRFLSSLNTRSASRSTSPTSEIRSTR